MSEKENEVELMKLKTEIERTLHTLICRDVKDHIRDFVMIAAKRNHVPVEKEALEYLVKTMEMACDNAFRQHVDTYRDKLCTNSEKYSQLVDQSLLLKKLSPKE